MFLIGDAVGKVGSGLGSSAASFRVEPDRVFELANTFDAIADDIENATRRERDRLWAKAPGSDKPSLDARDRLRDSAFGFAGLVTRTTAYAEELRKAAKGLRDTATQYGMTDHSEGRRLGAANL